MMVKILGLATNTLNVRNNVYVCVLQEVSGSAFNAIGTQMCGLINTGLTQWQLAYRNQMDAPAESGRNLVSKQFGLSVMWGMSRLTRDGTSANLSRETKILRQEGEKYWFFPVQLTTSRQPYSVYPFSATSHYHTHMSRMNGKKRQNTHTHTYVITDNVFKKNLNASKTSEHPSGGEMSKGLYRYQHVRCVI